MRIDPSIIFTKTGSVELLKSDIDVDFIADVARGCKYGAATPTKTKKENDAFIAGLWRVGHRSVFEHCHVTMRITCPIFVARQLMR